MPLQMKAVHAFEYFFSASSRWIQQNRQAVKQSCAATTHAWTFGHVLSWFTWWGYPQRRWIVLYIAVGWGSRPVDDHALHWHFRRTSQWSSCGRNQIHIAQRMAELLLGWSSKTLKQARTTDKNTIRNTYWSFQQRPRFHEENRTSM